MELFKGQKLFVLHYEPEIYIDFLEVVEVYQMFKSRYFANENFYRMLNILTGQQDKDNIWLERTLNLNKLIKQKYAKRFVSINEELIVKRLKTLLQYAPKKKEI